MTLHHIAADGWSQGLLWRELGTLYAAYARGQPSPLPELPLQYADFAVWQKAWLQGAGARAAVGLLAEPTAGPRAAGVAHGPPAAAATIVSGASRDFAVCRRGLAGQLRQLGRPQERDVAHDVAGRVPDAAGALQRAGGHRRRIADRRPAAGRVGTPRSASS